MNLVDTADSGQARTFGAPRQCDGWVFLDWKEPVDNDKAALRSARSRRTSIDRRERPSGPWTDVGKAIESEITL